MAQGVGLGTSRGSHICRRYGRVLRRRRRLRQWRRRGLARPLLLCVRHAVARHVLGQRLLQAEAHLRVAARTGCRVEHRTELGSGAGLLDIRASRKLLRVKNLGPRIEGDGGALMTCEIPLVHSQRPALQLTTVPRERTHCVTKRVRGCAPLPATTWRRHASAMAAPSPVLVPRPSSSRMTRLLPVAADRMAEVSLQGHTCSRCRACSDRGRGGCKQVITVTTTCPCRVRWVGQTK